MDGVLLVDKSVGISSFGVVSKVKKCLKTRDVGHCGTLDPMAEGLMVVCVNKALKIAKYLNEDRKKDIDKVRHFLVFRYPKLFHYLLYKYF